MGSEQFFRCWQRSQGGETSGQSRNLSPRLSLTLGVVPGDKVR